MIGLRAHCKINLGLRVLRRRADGFHDISTVMVGVPGLFDTVWVAAISAAAGPAAGDSGDSALEVSGPFGTALDCGAEQNICMRALRLLQRECGAGEALVQLVKRVPFGAGLGGGSADAAAVLVAGNEEFRLGLSGARLEELGTRLGSDVAFFLRSGTAAVSGSGTATVSGSGTAVVSGSGTAAVSGCGTAAVSGLGSAAVSGSGTAAVSGSGPQFCTGRGEVMTPVEVDLAGRWIAIAKPPFGVSTAQAYAGVTPCEDGPSPAEMVRRPIAEWRNGLVNDFETSVLQRHPQIVEIKRAMYDAGAAYASMSGSGSAVFGIFDARPTGLESVFGGIFLHVSRLD